MPKPFQRRMKRISKRLSKETKLVFKKKKNKVAKCSECKKSLSGLTKKVKVNRKFGGSLCSSCSRKEIKNRTRDNLKNVKEDVKDTKKTRSKK